MKCKYEKYCCYDVCAPDYCPEYEAGITTNADRIRAMSDEELADLLLDGCRGSTCDLQPKNEYGSVNCQACRMNWLREPVKEGSE